MASPLPSDDGSRGLAVDGAARFNGLRHLALDPASGKPVLYAADQLAHAARQVRLSP